ncbi:hypothetical protein [uncultured Duncaniella sp.]|uniref:hypothetical protein n=1 Tax=uncultured Duncaniella sp. TaxID=2768039 RepID=UPI0025AFEE9D|nr:hypothetical protein [uncultured Duncaniella sp.]
MDILSSKTVRVRKKHHCEYCMQSINPGDTATSWSYADGGQMFRCYAHKECESAVNRVEEFEQDEYIDTSLFLDDIYQFWQDNLTSYFTEEEWNALKPHQRCAEILDFYSHKGRYAVANTIH